MADTLGIRPVDTSIDRAYTQSLVSGIQQLGAQLRNDLTTIQTNRQLQNFSSQLRGIDPQSTNFGPQMVQAISANPLAAQSLPGRAAIGMLGSAHEAYLREQADIRNFNQAVNLAGINASNAATRDLNDFERKKQLMEIEEQNRRNRDEEATKRAIKVQQIRNERPTTTRGFRDPIAEMKFKGQTRALETRSNEAREQFMKYETAVATQLAAYEAAVREREALVAKGGDKDAIKEVEAKLVEIDAKVRQYRILKDRWGKDAQALDKQISGLYDSLQTEPALPQQTPSVIPGVADAMTGIGEPSLVPTQAQLPAPKVRKSYDPVTDTYK